MTKQKTLIWAAFALAIAFLFLIVFWKGTPTSETRNSPEISPGPATPSAIVDDPAMENSITLTDPAGEEVPSLGYGGFPERKNWEPGRVVDSNFEISYFDERRELEIVTNRIAVRHSELSEASAATSPAIVAAGFEEGDLADHAIAGWSIAQTVNALGENNGPDAVERISKLIRTLSQSDAAPDFTSPIFRDPDLGGLLVATPNILLGFPPELSIEERQDAVSAVPVVARAISEQDLDLSESMVNVPIREARTAFEILDLANTLASHNDVLFAEPDMIFEGKGALIPNDPEFGVCWGLRNTGQSGGQADFDMDADEAWDITTGSANVKVLIIDTGVQQDHPDIKQLTGRDFTSESGTSPNGGPVNADDRHGTPVAGCVSAIINNSLGAVGVAPGVNSISARCFISTSPSGSWTASFSWTANALNWAATQGVQVSNNSNGYGGTSSAVASAYSTTLNGGMIHFSSAGNNGSATIGYPANLPTVHAIAASQRNGTKAGFSQYGTGIAFIAPGTAIRLPDRTGADGYSSGDLTTISGTSFASPYTAGVAALAFSVDPTLTPAEVEAFLQTTSVDLGAAGYDTTHGWGHVNAAALVNAVSNNLEDNYEENDTYTTAYGPIAEDTFLRSIDGFASQTDDDWFEITVPAFQNALTIECFFTHSDGNVDLAIHDSSGNELARANSSNDDETLQYLASPAGGTFYLRVFGDDASTRYDLKWNASPAVDLFDSGGAYHSLSSSTVSQSGSVTISHRIENTGPSPSGSFTINYYFSPGVTITGSSILVAQRTIAGLGAGAVSNESFSLPIPSDFPTNTYYVGWTIDSNDVIEETDETNNYAYISSQPLTVEETPILQLGGSARTFGYDETIGSFSVTTNPGRTWSWSSPDNWFITSEPNTQTGNTTFNYTIPPNPDPFNRYATLTFTTANLVRTYRFTQIAAPPSIELSEDETATPSLSHSLLTRGQVLTVSHQLENTGNSPSGNFEVTYYLSTNPLITTGDPLLGTLVESSIGARTSVAKNNAFTVSTTIAPGTYYVGWIIDSDDDILETDELNNIAYTEGETVTIRTHLPPAAVTGLIVTDDGSSPIYLDWDAVDNAEGYEIWRGTTDDLGSMTKIADVTETSYTDTDPLTGDKYYYRIRGKNWNGAGASDESRYAPVYATTDQLVARPRSGLIGEDIYDTYSGQTAAYRSKRRAEVFTLQRQNENQVGTDILRSSGSRNNRFFKVIYLAPPGNVTSAMITGRYDQPVDAGTSENISIKIKVSGAGKKRKRIKQTVSTSTTFRDFPSARDIGLMRLIVKNKIR